MPRARGEISWSAVAEADRLRQLSTRLREAGRGDLQRQLTRGIRREGAGMLRATQQRWQSIQVTEAPSAGGGKSTGLRMRTAAATRIQILRSGIRMTVRSSQVDPRYGRSLTRGLDGLGRWRHPVFGNRNVWVQNFGQEIFYTTGRSWEPRFRRGVVRVMDDVARQIAG
jgi:CubicO group peptidase (beta-lactamase class C family)